MFSVFQATLKFLRWTKSDNICGYNCIFYLLLWHTVHMWRSNGNWWQLTLSFLSSIIWRSNSGWQTWWRVLLPTEPSHLPQRPLYTLGHLWYFGHTPCEYCLPLYAIFSLSLLLYFSSSCVWHHPTCLFLLSLAMWNVSSRHPCQDHLGF